MNFSKFTLSLICAMMVMTLTTTSGQSAEGGCETVTVTNVPTGPQTWGSWIVPYPCEESPSDDCCTVLSNPFQVYARFQLMEKQDDGSFLLLPEQLYQRFGQFTFEDLDHGTYKVQIAVPNPVPCNSNKDLIEAYNLQTGQFIGYYGYYSHATFYETNEVVVGPTNSNDISYTFIDIPETGSEGAYDFGEVAIMDVSQCKNYDQWFLAIFENGSTYNRYSSNGWVDDPITSGEFNLSEFWETKGWEFETFHNYTIQLVTENKACRNGIEYPNPNGWNNLDRSFFVCPFGSGCRSGQIASDPISITPNPGNSKFSFKNFQPAINVTYQLFIYDATGRQVRFENFQLQNEVDVSMLPSGLYIVNLLANGNEHFSGKFMRI